MNSEQLLKARQSKDWEQIETAEKLGVSQTYLSLLETGKRPITKNISWRAIKIFGLPVTALPFETDFGSVNLIDENELAKDLGTLGYPKLVYLQSNRLKNPTEILISALKSENLDSRLVEALPWLIFNFTDIDWEKVIKAAKINDLQNRLGFVINLARKLAEKVKDKQKIEILRGKELELQNSRLWREDTLCHSSLRETEKNWLHKNRSRAAKFWRVLSDLEIKDLDYGK